MTTSTRQNKIISWWPQGGTDPAQRYITPRLIADGWIAEVQLHLDDQEVAFGADETWLSIPWGCANINSFDFCGLQACTGALARVADVGEFQQGMTLLHRATGKPIGFYHGNPTNDPTLNPLWTSSRTAWYQRVEQSMFPIGLLRAKGIPVRNCVDAAGNGVGADQCEALLDYLRGYGPTFIEPRPLVAAGGFNNARCGSITIDFTYADDYEGFGGRVIPAAQLLGPKMILALRPPTYAPGSYAKYVRGIGTRTGADVAVIANRSAVGVLNSSAFRVTVR